MYIELSFGYFIWKITTKDERYMFRVSIVYNQQSLQSQLNEVTVKIEKHCGGKRLQITNNSKYQLITMSALCRQSQLPTWLPATPTIFPVTNHNNRMICDVIWILKWQFLIGYFVQAGFFLKQSTNLRPKLDLLDCALIYFQINKGLRLCA